MSWWGALAEPVPQFPSPQFLYWQPTLLKQQLPPLARRNDQFCFSTLHKPIMFTRLTQAESNCTHHQWKIPKPPFIFQLLLEVAPKEAWFQFWGVFSLQNKDDIGGHQTSGTTTGSEGSSSTAWDGCRWSNFHVQTQLNPKLINKEGWES